MSYRRAFVAVLLLCPLLVFAQTPGTGSVTISGSLLGPIYPCGRASCPTYDSGQIQVTVSNYVATTNYSRTAGQRTADQLAASLAAKLNNTSSPVTATVLKNKVTVTSKFKGSISNYALATSVTYNTAFKKASFTAVASGPTLTGGTGGPSAIGTLAQQTSNNTSLCSSVNDPGGNLSFCATFFEGFNTNPNNSGAQTLLPVSPAGRVSNLNIKQLIYSGWTGRLICEYQPWFGSPNHQSVGYNENASATVAAQNTFMISEGCDINLVDFYGSTSPNQTFNLATANAMFADLNSRSGYPLRFGILEDKGALLYLCPKSGLTEAATTACLQNALIQDMDYIGNNYVGSPVYWTDAGQPVIAYFGGKGDWPILTAADWDAVWLAVKAHTDAYAVPFKFIFQFGSFTTAPYDNGRFGWVQPPTYSSTNQFWWGSNSNASPVYLDTLYSAGLSHPSQLTIGSLYKGFDDNNASWGSNRVIAEQCGQVLLKSANEIAKYFGGANPQIPYVQVITWNDYEEGTAVEDGVDNCYTVNASLNANSLSWTLNASDPTYASTSTVHHFNVYFADAGNNLYPAALNLPVTAAALDLTSIVPAGSWNIYVEMVGQPLILNRMSNAVTLIH